MEYIIWEKPVLPDDQQGGNPVQEKPVSATPEQGNPVLENPVQLNTKESNKEKSNTDLSSTHSFCLSQGGENPRMDTESAADGLTDRMEDIETKTNHVSPVWNVSSSGEQKRYPFSAFCASILSHLQRSSAAKQRTEVSQYPDAKNSLLKAERAMMPCTT